MWFCQIWITNLPNAGTGYQILLLSSSDKLLGIQRQFSITRDIYIYLPAEKAEAEIPKAANMPKIPYWILAQVRTSNQLR